MRAFLKALVLFGLIALLVDLPFRWAMHALPATEYDDRLPRLLKGPWNADLIVLGSSRGARGVVPSVITELTGLSAHNLSYPGASIEFHAFMLDRALESPHPPHTVFLVVDEPSMLIPTPKVDFRLDRCYPVAGHDVVNRAICERTGKSRVITEIFASYRIKECLSNLWAPPRPGRFDTIAADGSMTSMLRSPVLDTLSYDEQPRPYPRGDESPELIAALEHIIQRCITQGVRLVIVHPPDLRIPSEAFVRRIDEAIAGRAEVLRYDMRQPAYRNDGFYYDHLHLNREGARIFSAELARYLLERRDGSARGQL